MPTRRIVKTSSTNSSTTDDKTCTTSRSTTKLSLTHASKSSTIPKPVPTESVKPRRIVKKSQIHDESKENQTKLEENSRNVFDPPPVEPIKKTTRRIASIKPTTSIQPTKKPTAPKKPSSFNLSLLKQHPWSESCLSFLSQYLITLSEMDHPVTLADSDLQLQEAFISALQNYQPHYLPIVVSLWRRLDKMPLQVFEKCTVHVLQRLQDSYLALVPMMIKRMMKQESSLTEQLDALSLKDEKIDLFQIIEIWQPLSKEEAYKIPIFFCLIKFVLFSAIPLKCEQLKCVINFCQSIPHFDGLFRILMPPLEANLLNAQVTVLVLTEIYPKTSVFKQNLPETLLRFGKKVEEKKAFVSALMDTIQDWKLLWHCLRPLIISYPDLNGIVRDKIVVGLPWQSLWLDCMAMNENFELPKTEPVNEMEEYFKANLISDIIQRPPRNVKSFVPVFKACHQLDQFVHWIAIGMKPSEQKSILSILEELQVYSKWIEEDPKAFITLSQLAFQLGAQEYKSERYELAERPLYFSIIWLVQGHEKSRDSDWIALLSKRLEIYCYSLEKMNKLEGAKSFLLDILKNVANNASSPLFIPLMHRLGRLCHKTRQLIDMSLFEKYEDSEMTLLRAWFMAVRPWNEDLLEQVRQSLLLRLDSDITVECYLLLATEQLAFPKMIEIELDEKMNLSIEQQARKLAIIALRHHLYNKEPSFDLILSLWNKSISKKSQELLEMILFVCQLRQDPHYSAFLVLSQQFDTDQVDTDSELIYSYLSMNRLDLAEKILNKSNNNNGRFESLSIKLAECEWYMAQDEMEKAKQVFESLSEQYVTKRETRLLTRAYLVASRLAYFQGALGTAIIFAQSAMKTSLSQLPQQVTLSDYSLLEGCLSSIHQLGQLLLWRGSLRACEQVFEKGLALAQSCHSPFWQAFFHLDFSWFHQRRHAFSSSLEHLHNVSISEPPSYRLALDWYEKWIEHCQRKEEWQQALEWNEKLEKKIQRVDRWQSSVYKSKTLWQLGKQKEAKKCIALQEPAHRVHELNALFHGLLATFQSTPIQNEVIFGFKKYASFSVSLDQHFEQSLQMSYLSGPSYLYGRMAIQFSEWRLATGTTPSLGAYALEWAKGWTLRRELLALLHEYWSDQLNMSLHPWQEWGLLYQQLSQFSPLTSHQSHYKNLYLSYSDEWMILDSEWMATFPSCWRIVSLTADLEENRLICTVWRQALEPFMISLPFATSLKEALNQWHDLIKITNETCHVTHAKTFTAQEKKEWWQKRRALDEKMKHYLMEFQASLGLLAFLLEKPVSLEHVLECKKQLEKWTLSPLDNEWVQCFLQLSLLAENQDYLEQWWETMSDRRIPTGLFSYAEHWRQELLKREEVTLPLEATQRHHLFLVLDSHLQCFSWENLPCLASQPIVRFPMLSMIRDKWQWYLKRPKVETPSIYYLLNPSGDLNDTQQTMIPYLKKLRANGLIGKVPREDALLEALSSHCLFLYFGHGGAEAYVRGSLLRRQLFSASGLSACVLLLGCSSGTLYVHGEFEAMGTVLHYLMGGSQTVLANAWDVTDKDIDRWSIACLEYWGLFGSGHWSLAEAVMKSRNVCQLRYLNGAAPIVYGLPVCWNDIKHDF